MRSMNTPTIVKTVPRDSLRHALHAMATLTIEVRRLHAELADRDEMLRELQALISRLT